MTKDAFWSVAVNGGGVVLHSAFLILIMFGVMSPILTPLYVFGLVWSLFMLYLNYPGE